MNISKATLKDLPFLYQIGKSTPEFRVSADEEFMPQDEFSYAIKRTLQNELFHKTFKLILYSFSKR